jgi:hypothetical protein
MTPVSKSIEPIYWSRRYVAQDIENGTSHIVAGTSHFTLPPKEGFSLAEIGFNWIYGDLFDSNYHAHPSFYLNWRTGGVTQTAHALHTAWNLNSEGLVQPLCKPLRWLPSDYFFSYEPPLAVTGLGWPDIGPEGTPPKPLRVLRCGSHADEVLTSSISPSASSVQAGGRVLSWIGTALIATKTLGSSETMFLTRLRAHGRPWHGKYYRILVPKLAHRNILLRHTSTMVFATGGEYKSATEIYYAHISKS